MNDADPQDPCAVSNADLRKCFGVNINIQNIGDNYLPTFIQQNEWVCILEFPEENSDRARFMAEGFKIMVVDRLDTGEEAIAEAADAVEVESVKFGYVRYQGSAPVRDFSGMLDLAQRDKFGESLRFKLYNKEVLVAETTDKLFFTDMETPSVIIFVKWLKDHGVTAAAKSFYADFLPEKPRTSPHVASPDGCNV